MRANACLRQIGDPQQRHVAAAAATKANRHLTWFLLDAWRLARPPTFEPLADAGVASLFGTSPLLPWGFPAASAGAVLGIRADPR
jgi:hypothetical protein